jgi:ribosomal protein S18 acetylase RimI-like enzyme
MSLTIRPLIEKDIRSVSDLHSSVFTDSRSTRLGKHYLRKMYRWFLEKQPHLCLVAEQDGQIVGFLVGAIGGYGRKIFRYAFLEILLGFILHPNLIFRREMFTLWYSYIQAFNPFLSRKIQQASSEPPKVIKASLSSIGVSHSAQGSGIGKKLVMAFEELTRTQGAELLSLSVLAGNIPARRLYESCGWQCVEKYSTPESAYYAKHLVRNNENVRSV